MEGGLQSNARRAAEALAQKQGANGVKGWIKAAAEADSVSPCPISPGFMAPHYWRIRFAGETYRHRRAGGDRQNHSAQADAGSAGACARSDRGKGSGEGASLARSRRHLVPAGFAR